jgi:hypothetical protein
MPVVGRCNHHHINIFTFQRFAEVANPLRFTILNFFNTGDTLFNRPRIDIANVQHIALILIGEILR